LILLFLPIVAIPRLLMLIVLCVAYVLCKLIRLIA
jgi:hypothetical protein